MAGSGGNKKRFQYCNDPSGRDFFYLRALQGHSGRHPIDPSLRDNVLIPNRFFEYIYHIGCAINLHSITNSELIPGGQNLSKRQTVFFTSVDPMNKEHRDPNNFDLEAPRLAWYKQKKWKIHQDTVYRVDIKLAQQKGFKFYHTRSNAMAQAILSQEAYGVFFLSLQSNRIDCCLSLSCVERRLWKVIRLTDHDASFVFASNSVTEFCGSGARVAVTQQ